MRTARLTVLSVIVAMALIACGRTALERPGSSSGDPFRPDEGVPVSDMGPSTSDDVGPVTDADSPDLDSPDLGGPDTGECPDGEEPGVEQCGNGIDDDCDGIIDEGCACNYQGVSVGVCSNGVISEVDGTCQVPDFFEADETSCDGRDNDCDGMTDEGCPCVEGETQECYNGPEGTQNNGPCTAGVQECVDGFFGGECVGEVTPTVETCNGIDDNCDGVVDEGCSCAFGGLEDGVCGDSQIDEFGNCRTPSAYQETEVTCDGLDNDCDGVVDEGCTCDFAGLSAGVCAGSTISETDGECMEPDAYEADEVSCDGKDNDCDGTTDEGCACDAGETQSCYDGPDGTDGVGTCTAGVQECVDGFFGACEGQKGPTAETCNGVDDDCDGTIDEGCACSFGGSDVGVCADGLIDGSGTCIAPPTYESDETTCDGLDNDCDGTVDEGCQCNFNGTPRGVCSNGTIAPDGECAPPPEYEAEETTCDGLNNDCDGATDEGCPCDFRGISEGVCGEATRNEGGQCRPPPGFTGTEAQCNDGIDNDCDGLVDCDDPDCANRPHCQ